MADRGLRIPASGHILIQRTAWNQFETDMSELVTADNSETIEALIQRALLTATSMFNLGYKAGHEDGSRKRDTGELLSEDVKQLIKTVMNVSIQIGAELTRTETPIEPDMFTRYEQGGLE